MIRMICNRNRYEWLMDHLIYIIKMEERRLTPNAKRVYAFSFGANWAILRGDSSESTTLDEKMLKTLVSFFWLELSLLKSV